MSRDIIGDMLTIIRNGLKGSKRVVFIPYSKEKENLLAVLKDEGYIKDFTKEEERPGIFKHKVLLKYVDGQASISEIKRVSRPGRRYYERLHNITPVIGGLGVSILSTSKGIMSDRRARELSVGGEVLCHVW